MGKKVLYVQYTNPAAYPPLEHSALLLADAGWEVLLLGNGAQGDSQNLALPPHARIRVQQLAFQPAGWRQKLHFIYFSLWVIIKTMQWRPGWVYASDLFACLPATVITFLPRIKVIYHEHDSPGDAPDSWFLKLLLWFRQKLAARAARCILPNQARAESFSQRLSPSQAPLVVWNCPMKEEVVAAPPKRAATQSLSLWYHGSIGPTRLPSSLLFALARLPGSLSLHITGYETISHLGYIAELKSLARELAIHDRLFFTPAIPRKALLQECSKHDIGLAFMPPVSADINMQHMAGASNKPFDYLACGLALLVSDLPEWKTMYVDTGCGLACHPEDPDSIVAALCWLLEHPSERAAMGRRGQMRILQDWNYEKQFAPVLSMMQKHREESATHL